MKSLLCLGILAAFSLLCSNALGAADGGAAIVRTPNVPCVSTLQALEIRSSSTSPSTASIRVGAGDFVFDIVRGVSISAISQPADDSAAGRMARTFDDAREAKADGASDDDIEVIIVLGLLGALIAAAAAGG